MLKAVVQVLEGCVLSTAYAPRMFLNYTAHAAGTCDIN